MAPRLGSDPTAPVDAPADPPRWLIVTGLVVGVLAVGSSAILIRWTHVPSVAVAFWRCLGGAAVLAPFAWVRRRTLYDLGRRDQRLLVVSGACLAVHFSLFVASLSFTTVASSVTLATASPPFVGLGAALFLDEAPSRRTWIGMAATLLGAVVVGGADLGTAGLGGRALLGDAMALVSAIAVSGYLLVGRSLRRAGLPLSVYGTTVYGAAALVLLPVCLLGGVPLSGWDAAAWLGLLSIVAIPQMLGHTVFNALMGAISATVIAIAVLAEPVVATVAAYLLLDEAPAALFWLGAPVILVGVYVAATGEGAITADPAEL